MGQQIRSKQVLFDSQLDFTSALKITNLANGTASGDAVNLSQLNAVASTINSLEWQDSAIADIQYIKTTAGAPTITGGTAGELILNTNNNTLYTVLTATTVNAGVALTEGQRYIFKENGTGTGTGLVPTANNNIYESISSVSTAITPTTGTFISIDDDSNNLWYWGGSSWVSKGFEATTASTGLTKVGLDIRLDSSAAGNGIGFATGVLSLDLGELTSTAIDVAADSIAFLDATDSGTKLESVSDLVGFIAGTTATSGLSATSGVMKLDINGLTADTTYSGTDKFAIYDGANKGITFANFATTLAGTTTASGLSASAGVLTLNINGLTADTAIGATDVFAMYDGANKKITWTNVLAAIDNSIFTTGNFVDGTTIDFTVTAGASVTAEVALASLTAAYLNDTNVPTAGQVLSAATGAAGTQFTWVDNAPANTPKRVRSAATAVPSGEGIAITDVFGADVPASNTIPTVYVNGIAVFVGDVGEAATADCWFAEVAANAVPVAFSALSGNENLVWDVVNAGYALDTSDRIEVRYEV